jgi:nucleoside-diphosphate-sugar epimerase
VILVTGATGRVGYRLMEALADARADATAMVRVDARAADLPGTRYADVGARVSAVFARQVDYGNQPPTPARKRLLASGLTPWQADGALEMFEWIRHSAAGTVTETVREVTGNDPRPVQDWLSEWRGAFVGRPPDLPPSAFSRL